MFLRLVIAVFLLLGFVFKVDDRPEARKLAVGCALVLLVVIGLFYALVM